jgi:hypothetical protein
MTAVEGIVGAITLVSSILFLIVTFLVRLFRDFEVERNAQDRADERARRRESKKDQNAP